MMAAVALIFMILPLFGDSFVPPQGQAPLVKGGGGHEVAGGFRCLESRLEKNPPVTACGGASPL